jgi:hypothetical protein
MILKPSEKVEQAKRGRDDYVTVIACSTLHQPHNRVIFHHAKPPKLLQDFGGDSDSRAIEVKML